MRVLVGLLLGLLCGPPGLAAWSVRLAWDAPTTYSDGSAAPPAAIGGYRLHYGTTPGQQSQVRDVGNVLQAVLDGLADGATYYVVVTVYDLGDTESAASMPELTVAPTVALDTTPPTVQVTTPADGSTVPRRTTITVAASAQDNVGVLSVVLLVDGRTLCTRTAPPYACPWAVPAANKRVYRLSARAYDAAANVGTAPVVTVTAQ